MTPRQSSNHVLSYLTALLIVIVVLACLFGLWTCSANYRARNLGGTVSVPVPAGSKVLSATWKGDQVWYVHRPFLPGETPQTVILQESSKGGVLEGRVIFQESK